MQVATVINKAWLAHARALAESLAEHEPDAGLSVLVVDPLEGLVDPAREPFEIIAPEQLAMADFAERSARYGVTELCCSLKAALVRSLLADHETVVYLDSDVRIYAPLEIEAALGEGSLLLTPHLLSPLPDDGHKPDDLAIVLGGAFNAGMFAARAGASSAALLDWWSARLRTASRLDPGRGIVYDQRWAELLPGLADGVSIWRDPGVNWGYWRAPQTPLHRNDNEVRAGDVPLRSLHFTGLDLDRPALLSRFDNRTNLDTEPVLRELRDEYVERLLAHGHDETSRWPYTFARTAGGIPLDATLRELWDRGCSEGALEQTPFSNEGEARFMTWLGEPRPGPDGLPLGRLISELHARDATLRARFPDPHGRDHEAVCAWAAEQAERDPGSALGVLLATRGRSPRAGLRRLEPGEQLGAARNEAVVCIPVYGAIDLFAECLAAVLDHTDPAVPILVADDASPDPGAWAVLQELEAAGRLSDRELAYLRQPRNLGFPGNVNACFDAAAPADVVVLNSDCVVACGWLDGLRRAASSDALVATASALTNHGTILSVPRRNEPQPALPQGKTLGQAAGDVLRSSLRLYPSLPTAIGHCMLIRRRALDLVGGFDPVFSPGYGEEVDFSQRCVLHGLVHVAADDVLVLHRAGGSFGSDGSTNPARAEHELILQSRYPYYDRAQTAASVANDTALARALSSARRALVGISATIDARCLGPIVTGTQIHTLEVIRALSETNRVQLRVIVPPDLGEHASEVLAGLRNIVLVTQDAIVGSQRTDVAHRPYQVFSTEDLELLESCGERTVITHQDLIAYRNPGYFPGFPQWDRYQRLTRKALGLADRVVFFSHHAARDAIREDLVAPERARVIYIGVDHGGDGAGREPEGCAGLGERPVLLCLGTDFRHKNRVFALRLLGAMREEQSWDGTLVLAGPSVSHGSSAADEARYLSTHPGLAENVVTLPAVGEAEKAWLLKRSEAVLYPTIFEGFGLMPFEAAAAGRPCLFASHTALAETLPAELATLIPWDPEASAQRVARLLADADACTEHVRRIAEAGGSFSWKSTGLQLIDVYNEAAASPAREATRIAVDLTSVDRQHTDYERKYKELWRSLTPAAVTLISPDGPLDAADRSALAAMAQRPMARRLLFGPLRLARRIVGRPVADAVATPKQTSDFALHVGVSNRSHMQEQLLDVGEQSPAGSARDWLDAPS